MDDEKLKEIERLMEVLNVKEESKRAIYTSLEAFRAQSPQFPPRFWDLLYMEMDMEEYMNYLKPIYDKHLDTAVIRSAIDFYTSPVGRKFLDTGSDLSTEIAGIIDQWSSKAGDRALERMEEMSDEELGITEDAFDHYLDCPECGEHKFDDDTGVCDACDYVEPTDEELDEDLLIQCDVCGEKQMNRVTLVCRACVKAQHDVMFKPPVCPECGASSKLTDTVCPECGCDLPQVFECPNCGANVKESDTSCFNCGEEFESEGPPPAQDGGGEDACPQCGSTMYNSFLQLCIKCGHKGEGGFKLYVCGKCDSVVDKDDKKCPNCGAELNFES